MLRRDLERTDALEIAKREIADRIRHVCGCFGEDEFNALVQRMAEVDLHFRLRNDWEVGAIEASPMSFA